MRQFIFGMDQQEPEKCADGLRARGIDAVVPGGMDARVARALKNAGLAGYLCFGALALGRDAENEAHWALHTLGEAARDALACAMKNAPAGPGRRALMQAIDISALPERFLQLGFAPGHAALETAAAREEYLPSQQLLPILQLEERRLPEIIAGVQAAGADGWGLFMFGQADF